MRSKIAITVLLGVLLLINWSIWAKEQHLANGRVVYLKLAPVDPRSIMQGDYMRLRFELATKVYQALPKTTEHRRWGHDIDAIDGMVLVMVDEQQIATFKALYKPQSGQAGQSLKANELLMHYRVRNGAVKFATDAYFFQEGHEPYYRSAQYGQFRVDDKGELLLTALYDNKLNKLGAE
jgi:uncharacterized membrane-anchored protein